ncbi:unnamed protein product [Caenorhabditis nigoni]|uniref:Protein kinase domain-containing protein n=1 Tax=Caenorhabditis nigoni TaxID=1611254 RepID=A0A2G5SF41_9PELO|nr:hypothetical protein B9Z55_027555 [Caenorhabditis nigoni]
MLRNVIRAPMNQLLDGRYKLTIRSGNWCQEEYYYGFDEETREQCFVKGRLADDPRIEVERHFLAEFGGSTGIPKFIGTFQLFDGEQTYIVHTRNGQKLETVLNESVFKISPANTVRLGYRLFNLIHGMHQRGYVHRDIRPQTIMVDVGWDLKLEIELSSFGFVAPTNPAPRPPADPYNSMKINQYTSYPAMIGEPFVPEDDYISVIFVLLASQGVNPFSHNINRQWTLVEKKEHFDDNPRRFVTPESRWLADLYWNIEYMRQERTFSHDVVIGRLENAVEGVDMRDEITHALRPNGHFYIL